MGVLGLIATVAFGGLSILLFLQRRYPGALVFVVEDSIALFDAIVRNLPELSVSCGGSSVGEGLVLLKGAILNTGAKDIAPSMVDEPLTFLLPPGYKWIVARAIAAPPRATVEIGPSQASLRFDLGLLRCRECVRLECLAEVPPSDAKKHDHSSPSTRLLADLKFAHRIADTRDVQRIVLRLPSRTHKLLRRAAWLWVVFGLGLVTAYLVQGLTRGWRGELHFMLPATPSGPAVEVRPVPYLDGSLELRPVYYYNHSLCDRATLIHIYSKLRRTSYNAALPAC
ncbi:MAG: hypothetical protein HYU66_02945 [Armatimonadetes bacterium]|nr:hypothetical protein [Armatimonadota bacterium]